MSTTVAMNTDAPATGSMGKYYTSKIGELREVSGLLVYDCSSSVLQEEESKLHVSPEDWNDDMVIPGTYLSPMPLVTQHFVCFFASPASEIIADCARTKCGSPAPQGSPE
jgi:hypothetical protein